jgi:hypothetical protein
MDGEQTAVELPPGKKKTFFGAVTSLSQLVRIGLAIAVCSDLMCQLRTNVNSLGRGGRRSLCRGPFTRTSYVIGHHIGTRLLRTPVCPEFVDSAFGRSILRPTEEENAPWLSQQHEFQSLRSKPYVINVSNRRAFVRPVSGRTK